MPRTLADLIRRISKGYGIPDSEARSLLGKLQFTVSLDDLTDVEATDVFSQRPCIGGTSGAGGVGTFFEIQLRNPERSGVIVVVEAFGIASDTDTTWELQIADTVLTNLITTKAFRDRRIRGAPAAEIRTLVSGGAGTPTGFTSRLLANDSKYFTGANYALCDGQGLLLGVSVAQIDTRAFFLWTEESAGA